MSKPGFLILSLTVYAAILTMLVASIARLALVIFPAMHLLMQWSSYTHFYTAHSFVHQQLSLAPRDPAFFIRCEPKVVTWVVGNRIQSIEEKDGNLVYKEGEYKNGTEHTMKTTLLARDCTLAVTRGTDTMITCTVQFKKDPHLTWKCQQAQYV